MFKKTNSLMAVVTAAKIVFISSMLGCYGFFFTTSALSIFLFFLFVAIFITFANFIVKKERVYDWLIQRGKKRNSFHNGSPVVFYALISTLIGIAISAYCKQDKYFLYVFVFTCMFVSLLFYCLKTPGTVGNHKGGEDQIIKFQGGKYELKRMSLNLGLLIFMFIFMFFLFNDDNHTASGYLKFGMTMGFFVCCFGALLCFLIAFYLGKKKLITGLSAFNVGTFGLENAIGLWLTMLASGLPEEAGCVLFLIIVCVNQYLDEALRKQHLPVDENIGLNIKI